MKLGNNRIIIIIASLFFFNLISISIAEDKILSSPLINLDQLEPSFEEVDEDSKDENNSKIIKNKKNLKINNQSSAKFIGLDKITAKTSQITINLGETKKFGPLEIKLLKCGKIKTENMIDHVAYMQVKDVSENENEKVFIFNGWTFASDPSLAPFDHAIYDLQLINCNKA
jgi:hypothetical protein